MNEQLVLLMMGVFYNQIGHILAGESYNLSTAPLKSSFTDPHLDCLILRGIANPSFLPQVSLVVFLLQLLEKVIMRIM